MLGRIGLPRIVESLNALSEEKRLFYKKRTMAERLFGKLYGKKWAPFRSHKLVSESHFVPAVYQMNVKGELIIYIHPALLPNLERELAKNIHL